ncbi:MAG TPA: extracellular solute-binding protein, partial [Stenomitos sp.]
MRKGSQPPRLGWRLRFRWGYGFGVRGIQSLSLSLGIAGLCVSCQSLKPQQKNLSQPTTVKLSGWGASPVEKKLLLSVIRDFEATHPHIRVQFEVIADQYMDVLKTRLVGDAGPDAFYLDAVEAPFFMQAQVLEPLNAYIKPDFDLADFEPTLLQAFQINSTLYGLPKDYSTLALFYNQQAFQKVGLKAAPTTWPQLQAAAQRLTLDRNQDGKPEQ